MKVEFSHEELKALNNAVFGNLIKNQSDENKSYSDADEFKELLAELEFDCRTIQKTLFHGDIVDMIKSIANNSKEKTRTRNMLFRALWEYLDLESSDDIISVSYNKNSDTTTVTYYVD